MSPAGRRRGSAGRRASGAGFLAGVVVGAVMAAAAIILLQSPSQVVQAAAAVPLTAAVAGTVAVVVLSARGGAVEDADAAQAASIRTPDPASSELPPDRDQPASVSVTASEPAPPPPDQPASGSEIAPKFEPPASAPPHHSSEQAASTQPVAPEKSAPDAQDVSAPPSPEPDFRPAIIEAWKRYRIDGDGFFTTAGLQAQLDELAIGATVRDGDVVNASGDILVVEVVSSDSSGFFVVPSFTNSPSAAPQWFEDASGGARHLRTRTIHNLAEGKWTDSGFEVIKKGVIG